MSEIQRNTTDQVEYACVFCRTGGEAQIALDLQESFSFVETLNPVKLRYRHINGKLIEEKVPLFPGYIFVRLHGNDPLYRLMRSGLIYKILKDSDDDWRLSGSDREFAEKLFETGGVFGFSQAFYENDRIRIVDGPLKAYDGKILRVNHRKRTAQVQMSIQGMEMNVWLGFELIENKN